MLKMYGGVWIEVAKESSAPIYRCLRAAGFSVVAGNGGPGEIELELEAPGLDVWGQRFDSHYFSLDGEAQDLEAVVPLSRALSDSHLVHRFELYDSSSESNDPAHYLHFFWPLGHAEPPKFKPSLT